MSTARHTSSAPARNQGGQRPTRSKPAFRPSGAKPSGSSNSSGKSYKPQPVRAVPALAATREPRPAVSSFTEAKLPQLLITALERRDIRAPFAIQGATLPDALAGEHLLGRAQTGAGKTLGFGIPMLVRLAELEGRSKPSRPRGLVLVPTRELAQQVADALAPLAQALGLKLTTVYGGTSMFRQIQNMHRGVDIVVATPGRLTDLIERKVAILDEVAVAVLDEADHMCDLGFLPVVTDLLRQVPADGQRMLFSATLDGGVDKLVREFLPNPVLVAVDAEVSAVSTMEHHAFEAADRGAKLELVTTLAGGLGRTLLFTRTKHGADRLADQLSKAGVPAKALHGGMQQNARTRALKAFSDGTHRVLVATDVAARGIHVDDINLVIHADPPTEPKAYLHRSGRTARAGAGGTVVAVSLPEERRTVTTMLRAAGIHGEPVRVRANDNEVRELVGPAAPFVAWAPNPPSLRPERTTRPPRRDNEGRRDFAPRSETRGSGAPVRTDRPAQGRTDRPRRDEAPRSTNKFSSHSNSAVGSSGDKPNARGDHRATRGAAPHARRSGAPQR